ncbi:MAG: orotate phosphoribosyltransferase, partial [Muribaculaceae bacterium]|nr:orotate phosphoribosyltransferase [Muribaculaceae bacterium]MDE7080903.1 orotate phosphoribosyltransferase [Muribaculaceae bacterium]
MNKPHKLLAEKLLHISAIKLQPESPFVWASGWNSPIYTDNRIILSYPDVRNFVKVELARTILEHYPEANAIAGVATGAIAIGAIVADALGLPYVYVRHTPKDHGLENMIEGNLRPGSKVVIVEDIVSTGASSLKAVDAVQMAGCDVVGMTCLFNFQFPEAVKRISDANLSMAPLLTYSEMLEVASEIDYISPAELETLRQWREDPAAWTPETY